MRSILSSCLVLILLLACSAGLQAQSRTPITASETSEFREAQPGEWAYTNFITWAPRYVNVTDVRGFDDSLSRRFVPSLTFVSARYERAMKYRLSHQTWFSLRPTASFGYGYSAFSSHEEFRLNTVDREVAVPAKFGVGQIHADLGASFGIWSGAHEVYLDWSSLFAWRFQSLKARVNTATDPVSGLVDSLREPLRRQTHLAQLHSLGVGYALHVGNEPWNYRIAFTVLRVTEVSWNDHRTLVAGSGFDVRADGFRLSDDVGLALHFKFDWWLPRRGFNDIFWFELGVGVRFS